MNYIGIDIGGTWIKGTSVDSNFFNSGTNIKTDDFDVKKIQSPLNGNTKTSEVMASLTELISLFNVDFESIQGIGISTPGIVDYHGTRLISAGPHLTVLKNGVWKSELNDIFKCPVNLINDADAAAIGLAELGRLNGNKTIGIMPIGTGVGFSIWRNGRRWRPGKMLPLLGDICFADTAYNYEVSASRLAGLDSNKDLLKVLQNQEHQTEREVYFQNLASVIKTAAILYSLDEVILCGGLVDAARDGGFDWDGEMNSYLTNPFNVFDKTVHIKIANEGNKLQLIGNLTLAQGEFIAARDKVKYDYRNLETETPYQSEFRPEQMESLDIIKTLWAAEQEAGNKLEKSLQGIATLVDKCVTRIQNGARIIYIGAGTSGRIAAMDAVEIPCTYGFPEERILALIAGGMSEATLEIESDFEEDASAVPEMLLLNIGKNDVVIGISASGTAYYVQSALAFAKSRGALTAIVQVKVSKEGLPFCDHVIPLASGSELINGSTRMKAGTATKKVLNFFSSTLMMKLGKVMGPHMVDVICTNDKLVERAQNILKELFDLDENEALQRLMKVDMNLGQVVKSIRLQNGIKID